MPIPEHIPSFIDTPVSAVVPGHIHCIEDVNNAVKSVIWGITQHLQYTGIGRVLDTLFKTCPGVYTYLRSTASSPENIPAIVEHKRLIQRVNTQFWAYATTRNVITLTDMEELIKADIPDQYMLLGPVVHIPSVLEICQTSHFHPRIVDAFTLSQVSRLRMTNEHVLRELYDCVCHNRFRLPTVSNRRTEGAWWESVFTHHMLLVIGIREVPRQLDRNTSYDYKLTDLAQFGIRINGFSSLIQSVLANLRPENLTKASQIAQECLTEDVRKIYDKFASELLSQSALNTLRAQKPVKALKHLAECASSLHGELSKWAEERGVSWPPGHLDSLLIFGQFIQRIANGGPFRTLIHLLMSISIRPSTSAEALIRNLITAATQGSEHLVVDLTTSPVSFHGGDGDSATVVPHLPTALDSDSFLRKVVQQFNEVLDKACADDNIATDPYQDEGFWQMLAKLERSLLKSTLKSQSTNPTLLGLLANAAEQGISGLTKVLYSTKNTVSAEPIPVESDEDAKVEKTPASFSSMLDPYLVCRFVRKLTWLHARSVEDVCQLVSVHLRVSCSDELKQVVRSALNEFSAEEHRSQEPVIYHHHLNASTLPITDLPTPASTISWPCETSVSLFVHRDSVLELLAACPSLVDLEVWSQWSMPGMLLERWGELEQFLLECGPEKVCNEYNLLVLRLLDGGGLLRLHASLPTTDWEANFIRWSDHSNPQSVRNLCDLLIGSALGINTYSVTCSQGLLSVQLSKLADSCKWISLVRDILLTCPSSLLGCLFSKIILPCVDEVGYRSINSWSTDVPDLPTTLTNPSPLGILPLLRDAVLPKLTNAQDLVLVSAIGSLGLQLNWPAFVSYFEEHRLRLRGTRALETNLPLVQNEEFSGRLMVTSSPPVPSVPVSETIATQSNFEPDHPVYCDSNQTDREGFIAALRRREFGCGAELSTEAVDLIRRVEGKLSRSLVQLSEDLYGQPGHFLLELIQNADDNEYHVSDKVLPTLEFCLILRTDSAATPAAALLVMNNEAVGFTEADMSSLCDVGVSTKLNQRNLKTGRKGIGFKSVFNVTDAPEVHSNGFHVRFHRHSLPNCTPTDESGSLLLVPEWCATTSNYNREVPSTWPVPIPTPSWCKTMFVLPLSSKANASVKQFTSVMHMAQETLQPSVMLFLRRLRCLTVSCVTEKKDDQKFPPTRRNILSLTRTAFPLSSEAPSAFTAELISVASVEQCLEPSDDSKVTRRNETHFWFCFKENLIVDDTHLPEGAPTQTELSLAISLTDPEPLSVYPVFAYLPIREAGFSFYINADFDLTSSREDVNSTSTWNQWLVSRISTVFAHMIQYVLQLPEKAFDSLKVQLTACGCSLSATRNFLLGRFLASLPYISSAHTSSSSHSIIHHGNLFVGLPAQLRVRLSQLAWLPAVERLSVLETERLSGQTELSSSRFVCANQLLLSTSETKLGSEGGTEAQATQPSRCIYLVHLLMDRLGMREPHPDLLCSETNQVDPLPEDTSDSFGDRSLRVWKHDLAIYRSRREALLWLGVQTVSVDSLLELVSNLSKDEVCRPGLLGLLIDNFETAISTQSSHQLDQQNTSHASIMLKRRVLTALRHLAIFPLTTGQIVRCSDTVKHPFDTVFHPAVLLPPLSFQLGDHVDLPYDDYIQLINKLGPLVSSVAFETDDSTLNDRRMGFSSLLTAAPPDGLGMRVALPETVLSEWILPCLNSLSNLDGNALQHSEILNWLVVVGRLYVSSPRLSQDPAHVCLPRRMPIITSDHSNGWHILPALTTLSGGIRELPVFLPPASFTILQKSDVGTLEELESKLFHLLIDQLDKADLMRVVSNKYFENFPSLVEHAYRWFQFFSGAGVCTLLSVHSTRYLVSTAQLTEGPESKSSSTLSASNLLPLPHGHRLWKIIVQTLTKAGLPESAPEPNLSNDEWIIEDFVCPGLDLLLRLIAHLSDRALALEASYQLACLLHDNWPAFEGVDRAWFAKVVPEMSTDAPLTSVPGTVARPLGPACWLHNLRETAWLPIEHPSSVDLLPRLVSPCTAESHVYSPSVLVDLRTGRSDIVRLLLEACYVWSPGPHIVRDPPNLAFTLALGLSNELHRSTFDDLMSFLSTQMAKNNSVTERLTPDLMVELYRVAVHCCTSSKSGEPSDDVEWLRSVFAHSERSSIVVRCPNSTLLDTFTIDRRGKRPRQEGDDDHRRDLGGGLNNFACPICLASSQSLRSDQRRHQSSTDLDNSKGGASYHLVPPDLVCWTQARLPIPDSVSSWSSKRPRSDDEEEDDRTNARSDQCVLSTSSVTQPTSCDISPVVPNFTDHRVFQLCTCYSFGCRSFFVDILGVASTSSVEQVLLLRPELGDASTNFNENQWCNFGRRLGQWYALLDHCLLEDGFIRSPSSLPTHKSQVKSLDVNESNDSKMTQLVDQLWNFPLLFGFDGKWHKPCEVTTVSAYNGVRRDVDSTATSTSSISVFAWSKPLYARFVRMAGGVNSSVVVLAHSLRLLDSRHKPEPGQMQDSSVPASARLPNLAELGGKRLSSSPAEGTSHGLLLDTLGLPVIDQVGQLRVEHKSRKSNNLPCVSISQFFDVFLRIARLWITTYHSTNGTASTIGDKSHANSSCKAFLVNQLIVELQFHIPLLKLDNQRLSRRVPVFVDDDMLYVDSTLGADLFARLSSLPKSHTAPLVYLCVGLLDDVTDDAGTTDSSLLASLADYVCPDGGSDRLTFIRFMQGFVNMASSLVPDLRATLGSNVSFLPSAIRQLENYLISHGVRKVVAKRAVQQVCQPPEPTEPIATTCTPPSDIQHSLPLVTSSVASEREVGRVESTNNVPVCPPVSSSTRRDTVFGNFSVRIPFTRLGSERTGSSSLPASCSKLWAASVDLTPNLTHRLRRMLTQSACGASESAQSLMVGRMGELYVYQHLIDMIARSQEKGHHFDQLSDLEFPTGHPSLGAGRVVQCRWCNANEESRRPFDLELEVQVECEASTWDRLLSTVKDELAQNIVKIVRSPSKPHVNPPKPGLLLVGPIFLEVKSTAGRSMLTGGDCSTDMFELSVSELVCASQQGWRYHLIRVLWDRDPDNASTPSLTKAPTVVHVPDFVTALRTQPSFVKLCVAMLRTT